MTESQYPTPDEPSSIIFSETKFVTSLCIYIMQVSIIIAANN
jgi:hypothetical protein